jgi:hypothetical protein
MFLKKFYAYCILTSITAAILSACGGPRKGILPSNNVSAIVESQIASESESSSSDTKSNGSGEVSETGSAAETTVNPLLPELKPTNKDGIDYDLTAMDGDLIYASVYQMMVEPELFEGKVIKITGRYYASFYDPNNRYYHYVIIEDAMACCAQGMEFVWDDGNHVYPDEYPEDNTYVEVVGTFETYEESDGQIYCRLKDASFKVLDNNQN